MSDLIYRTNTIVRYSQIGFEQIQISAEERLLRLKSIKDLRTAGYYFLINSYDQPRQRTMQPCRMLLSGNCCSVLLMQDDAQKKSFAHNKR